MLTAAHGSGRLDWVDRMVGEIVDHIHLNSVKLEKTVVIKRRNPLGRHILPAANWFFRRCHAPVYFMTDPKRWQHWELSCYRMLNPDFHAMAGGDHCVCEERLPGESLWTHLKRGTLTPWMLIAAGREFRRGHGMWSPVFKDKWSHGDGAMRNVLFDAKGGRCRLLDFELVHLRELSAEVRQADDLSAFLLDLAGYATAEQWLPYAMAFLRGHGDAKVLAEVRRGLSVPGGSARVWWKIRTNFVSTKMIRRRLLQLARGMDHGALSTAEGALAERRVLMSA
jgi:hypothetical protein